jgi:hypothetical protein
MALILSQVWRHCKNFRSIMLADSISSGAAAALALGYA